MTDAIRYRISHATRYRYGSAVPVCHNEIILRPRQTKTQATTFCDINIEPEPSVLLSRHDYFGNLVGYFELDEPHDRLCVEAISEVEVTPGVRVDPPNSPAWEDERDRQQTNGQPSLTQFVYPSPLTIRSPELAEYAAESFTQKRPIWAAARELTSRIFTDFEYDVAATDVTTPTRVAFEKKRGVCQDFAHVQISCLRSLGLAARYVSGYLRTIPPPGEERLMGADASHAWLQVYCGEEAGWCDFDPTNDVVPGRDHVTLAWGRDYADVCPIKGVLIGGGSHQMSVSVDVAEVADD